MSMQFLAKRPTDSHRSRRDIWTIYQANTDITGKADYCHISGAPVVAVKHNGIFHPRRPELDETYGSVTVQSRLELQMTWNERERQLNYDELAKLAVFYGIHPYYDLLKDTALPNVDERARNPFGGFPESAFHDGVTADMLGRRRAKFLAALINLGALADPNTASGHRRTAKDDAAAALENVDRMWREAFAKREPLPPETLRWFIDAQLWWSPHIYTGEADVIDAKPAQKLLPKPKSNSATVHDWS